MNGTQSDCNVCSTCNHGRVGIHMGLRERRHRQTSADIRDAAVFAAPNENGESVIWVAVVADSPPDFAALHAFCRERLGPRAPARFLRVPSLPRNENMKLVVSRLRDAAAQSLKRVAG